MFNVCFKTKPPTQAVYTKQFNTKGKIFNTERYIRKRTQQHFYEFSLYSNIKLVVFEAKKEEKGKNILI